MFWKWFWKAFAFLLVLAIFVGGGISIYRAGYVQGANVAAWSTETGAAIPPTNVVPQPGSFTRLYARPLVLLPFFSLFLGFLFLMALFGGIRRYTHYKMWKSAGMPGPEGFQPHWHNHHRGPFWGPPGYSWNKPEKTEDPRDEPTPAEPQEDA